MSRSVGTILTLVLVLTQAESHVVLGGQPLILGAHHQPAEAELAHAVPGLHFTWRLVRAGGSRERVDSLHYARI